MDQIRKSPTVRRRRLAHILRRLREDAGFTLAAVSSQTGMSHVRLARMETAQTNRCSVADVRVLTELYQLDAETREHVLELTRESRQLGWWASYRDVYGEWSIPSWEAEASTIGIFGAQLVPDLFQTPRYAAASLRGGRAVSDETVERLVSGRLNRQHILGQGDPPSVTAVIDEAVLHRRTGGVEVMREQLEHLVQLGLRPNIELRVLPYEAEEHLGSEGAFTILGFPDPSDGPVVHVKTATSALLLESPDELATYDAILDNVQGVALSAALSAEFVEEIANSLEEPCTQRV